MKTKTKPATRAKKRILIVEDEPTTLELLSTLAREAGYVVDQAEHALAAVFCVVRALPDLILTDLRMPIVDGLRLVRELKAHTDTRHIPVVVVTGHDSPEVRAAARKAGCAGYIPKPIDVRRFPRQLAQLLRQSKPKRS